MPDTGWAIINKRDQYLTVDEHGTFLWTANPKQAILLVREQDAMALARANSKVGVIGEQRGWEQLTPPAEGS